MILICGGQYKHQWWTTFLLKTMSTKGGKINSPTLSTITKPHQQLRMCQWKTMCPLFQTRTSTWMKASKVPTKIFTLMRSPKFMSLPWLITRKLKKETTSSQSKKKWNLSENKQEANSRKWETVLKQSWDLKTSQVRWVPSTNWDPLENLRNR